MSIPLILALNTGQKRLLFGFDLATENRCFYRSILSKIKPQNKLLIFHQQTELVISSIKPESLTVFLRTQKLDCFLRTQVL